MPNVVDIPIEEGLQKGLQEGLQKGQRDAVVKLLEKGVLTPDQIASALDLDLSRVQEIQAEIDRGRRHGIENPGAGGKTSSGEPKKEITHCLLSL